MASESGFYGIGHLKTSAPALVMVESEVKFSYICKEQKQQNPPSPRVLDGFEYWAYWASQSYGNQIFWTKFPGLQIKSKSNNFTLGGLL